MKKISYIAIISTFFTFSVYAAKGHNGIQFDMTQKQIEAMDYACNPPKEKNPMITAECFHMDMTGKVFGYKTQDYEVRIGPSGKVDMISANIIGVKTLSDIIELHLKIQKFFPIKDEEGTHRKQGMYSRDAWRAKDGSGISLFLFNGIPPVIKTTLDITFQSPRSLVAIDKFRLKNKKESAKK